ncbi:MAG: discoidin domain-containing protein [Odoribacter sp.]|nr:discoidin domain-containing protein [Odoribacter sp.]
MRYISLFIGAVLALSACQEVKFAGYGNGTLTAGFRDTLVTVFENTGTNRLVIDFSQKLVRETKVTVAVVAEENMQEGKDYLLPFKEFSVAAGAQSVEVEYGLVDDNKTNDSRSFTLRLVSLNGGAVDEGHADVRVKVLDDESDVAVGFETTVMTVSERESGTPVGESYRCEIPVKVYGTLHKPLQFEVVALPSEGPDAAVEDEHFRLLQTIFVVENAEASISVPVEILDDDKVNADRLFTLDIVEVTGGETYTHQKRCIVTVKNDDLGIYFGKASVEAEERAGKVKVPVKLTQASEQPVTFVVECSGTAVEGTDYSLEKSWTIEAGQDSIELEVELLHASGVQDDRVLTLAFAGLGEDLQVFEKQPACDVTIWDVDTQVEFKYDVLGMRGTRGNLMVPVVLATPLAHDVSLSLNSEFPEGVEAIVKNASVTIPAGETSAVFEVQVTKMMVERFTMSIHPDVKGASASENPELVSQFGEIEEPWTLTIAEYSSQATNEPEPNGYATAAVDGDPATYWHSSWSPATELPQYIVVQVPDNIRVGGVEVIRRLATTNSDSKKAEISLSKDRKNWDFQGTLEWDEPKSSDVSEHTRSMDFNHLQKGGYIKINVTETRNSTRSFGQIAEVIIYGYAE